MMILVLEYDKSIGKILYECGIILVNLNKFKIPHSKTFDTGKCSNGDGGNTQVWQSIIDHRI